jgi:hypothetical protein
MMRIANDAAALFAAMLLPPLFRKMLRSVNACRQFF